MPISRIKGSTDILADVETVADVTDDIDGKAGIVTNSMIFGRTSADVTRPCAMRGLKDDLDPDLEGLNALVVAANIFGRLDASNVHTAKVRVDDDSIAQSDTHLVVINLNYVDDGAGNWVRMTQPT